MRLLRFELGGRRGLAKVDGDVARGMVGHHADIVALIATDDWRAVEAELGRAPIVDLTEVRVLPPIERPGKIICVGLNYRDHSAEVAMAQPDHPTLFTRFASTLVGHGAPLVRPRGVTQFDYEGEVAMLIGRAGRRIAEAHALDYVAGWSLFNDASVRDWQFRTSQWTLGKNADATGAFGPWFVPAFAMPPGLAGLTLETRLNGAVVQRAMTDDMVFSPARQIAAISEAMTLELGDVIVTGTPAGVGMGRTPPLWMQPGDVVEVALDGLGVLRNVVTEEA